MHEQSSLRAAKFGHAAAIITILIWGNTFISTKLLLQAFSPVEILFTRFLIGFIVLLLIYPRRLIIQDRSFRAPTGRGQDSRQTSIATECRRRVPQESSAFEDKAPCAELATGRGDGVIYGKQQELLFIAAGFSGIALYYLLENIALTLTTASNVGIIITIAPFFTAILSRLFLKSERPSLQFYLGFLAAIAGVALISYNGSTMQLNPKGDLLAILAAVAWAAYSILTRKISALGYNTVQTTRRIFFYGLLLMLPILFLTDFRLGLGRYREAVNVANILFLGLGASALCFVTWNTAIGLLGAVKTSVYIYLVPFITVAASVLILHEPLTPMLAAGTLLTLLGLWLSET